MRVDQGDRGDQPGDLVVVVVGLLTCDQVSSESPWLESAIRVPSSVRQR